DSTSWCGSLRTNPTVSDRSTVSPPGSARRRTVASRVENRRSSTRTPAPVSRLSSVDLPALVYPTRATRGCSFRRRALRCVSRVGWGLAPACHGTSAGLGACAAGQGAETARRRVGPPLPDLAAPDQQGAQATAPEVVLGGGDPAPLPPGGPAARVPGTHRTP